MIIKNDFKYKNSPKHKRRILSPKSPNLIKSKSNSNHNIKPQILIWICLDFLGLVDNWMKELVIFLRFILEQIFLLILELHFEIFVLAISYFMLKEINHLTFDS